jgi:PAS domain S-box-containing protein
MFLIGLCISAAGALWLARDNDANAHKEFDVHVQRLVNDVTRRFRLPVHRLNGARDMYTAAKQVERADGAPQFDLRLLGNATYSDLYSDMCLIKFIEPASSNRDVLGCELGSEALRHTGVERAIETGNATMTAPVAQVEDEHHTPGFLLFMPVFVHGAELTTPTQRRAALVGLLYAPIVAAELLHEAADVSDGMANLDLVDIGIAPPSAWFVFSSRLAQQPGRFNATQELKLLGCNLTISVHSTTKFDQIQDDEISTLLFIAGGLISAWLAALLWRQIVLHRRAEHIASGINANFERLAQLVKHTSNSVAITDTELRIVWINEGFTRISGYTMDEARGRTHDELLSDGSGTPAVLKQLISDGFDNTGCRVEILYCAKGARDYWLDAEFKPMLNLRGELNGFMEIGGDVTERRSEQARLEAALRENEALLRTIDLHAIVTVADPAGKVIATNDAFCRISGYARDELIGKNHCVVTSGVQPKAFWAEMWFTINTGAPWRNEICNRAKDGSLYWVDMLIAPFQSADGKIDKYISISTDITASKNATRELASERRRLANILQGTNAGTWEWNIETGALHVNERWAQMIGYSLAELGNVTIDIWKRFMHPDDISSSKELLRAHFKGQQADYEFEARLRHKQGNWIWVLLRGRLFARSEDGRARQMAGTQMEITQRRAMESALRSNNEVMTAVLENLPCGLSVFDADLRLVASNSKLRRLLDFPDTLLEQPDVHLDDFIRYIDACGEYSSFDVETTVHDIIEHARAPAQVHQFDRLRLDGTPLEIRGAPMPGGGFVTTYTDISDRRKAEVQRSAAARRDRHYRRSLRAVRSE